jgi:outer membrane protein OmpA-like peptidoglycan-associated protein
LVKYKELTQLTNYLNKAYDIAMNVALDKEEISGETIEVLKTKAMIQTQKDKTLEENNKKSKAKIKYIRLTSTQPSKLMCRPTINILDLPTNINDLVKLSLNNNYKIKAQIEKIKEQQEIANQEELSFTPKINFNLNGIYDKDIELANDGIQKEILGKLSFNWNFYSGGKNIASQSKERIKLNQEKKTLEKVKKEIIEKVTNLYTKFNITKKRINNYKESLKTNKEILQIYREQLADGTKTFIDLLSTKAKVISSQKSIITQEFTLLTTYYELLKELSLITESITNSKDRICTKNILINNIKEDDEETEDLNNLLDDSLTDNPTTTEPVIDTNITIPNETKEINNTFEDNVSKIFKDSNLTFDKKTLSVTLNITSNSFTKTKVNNTDIFKKNLDNFIINYLKFVQNNKNLISTIEIDSYTSSEYRKYTNNTNKFNANTALSQRRANKLKTYFLKIVSNNNLDTIWFKKNIKALGKGPADLILKNGIEDKKASKRIIIKIIKK